MLKKHIGDRQTGLVFVGRTGNPMVVGNVNEYVLKPILKKVEFALWHACDRKLMVPIGPNLDDRN